MDQTKILFASRHQPSPEQLAELGRAFPDGYSLEVRDILWEGFKHVYAISQDYDFVIGVFPQYLIAELAYWSGYDCGWYHSLGCKIVLSVSSSISAPDGTIRPFVHQKFVGIDGHSAWA